MKLPYGATDDEKAAGLAKLSWAVARIKAGESFAEVARDTSDDTGSAIQGGDLGDKTDSFVPAFKAAADALAPGQSTAGAVETQFGYHFIMRDDPAKAPEVAAQVKRGLGRSMYAKATATDATKRIATQIQAAMHGGKSADDALRDAIAGFVRAGGKVEPLRVLPGPAGEDEGHPRPEGSERDGRPRRRSRRRRRRSRSGPSTPASTADRPQVQTSSAFNRGGDPVPGLSPEGTTSIVNFAFSGQDGDVTGRAGAHRRRVHGGAAEAAQDHHGRRVREGQGHLRAGARRAKRDEALSLYVKRLREQAKDDMKIDHSFVQEAKVDGGASSSSEDEDEY